MIEIRVRALGAQELSTYMANLPALLEKTADVALQEASAAILNKLRLSYRQETTPSGVKWPPSRAGLRHKARGTGQTMFDTGDLWRSIQLYKTKERERLIGTDVPYATKHQGPNAIVERTFLEITQAHLDMAKKIFEHRLKVALTIQ